MRLKTLSGRRFLLILIILLALIMMSFLSVAFTTLAQATTNLAKPNVKQSTASYNFTRDLSGGNQGDDVKALQQFLNSNGFPVSLVGLGSPGNETTFFGQGTKTALVKWQTANNILPATGNFGPKSRSTIAKVIGESFSASALSATQVPPAKNVVLALQARSGIPVRLVISKLKVDTIILGIGLTAAGAMDVPKGPKEVAWFNLGPRPGEIGNAVISGHYGWKDGIPAVFDNLKKLQPGDKLLIKDEKGVSLAFVVRKVRVFGEKEDASTVFNSSDGKAHLNLITCGGVYNKTQKSYSQRLVIFADKD